jgi:aldose 1-epimerase
MPARDAVATSLASPSGEQFEIVAGGHRAVIVEVGGGIRSYSVEGQELLDGYGVDEMAGSGRGQVLMPWPNRVRDGTNAFDGRRHQLDINEPELGNAIHGLVRWVAWSVVEREAHRVVVRHTLHPQPGYPFTLRLQIEYELSAAGLAVRTSATNAGTTACPFGSGAHPWVAAETGSVDLVSLHVPSGVADHVDERSIPTGEGSVEGTELDFRVDRPIGPTKIDHAFTDVERDADGLARVRLRQPSGQTITVWFDAAYRFVQLSTGDVLPDVNRRSLAVEPTTCPPNAFQTGEALIRLEPKAMFTGRWGITPGPANGSGSNGAPAM